MSTSPVTLSERLREAAAVRGEQVLAELPATLRRLRLFVLVMSIRVPVLLAALLALLVWRLLG